MVIVVVCFDYIISAPLADQLNGGHFNPKHTINIPYFNFTWVLKLLYSL